jgi:hypothetical protein
VPLYTAVAVAGCFLIIALDKRGHGSPWIDAKALATASPAPVGGLDASTALEHRRGAGDTRDVAAAAIAVCVLWSNALTYSGVWLAPYDRLAELESIGHRFAGDGPALMTEHQPYGVRYFLGDLDPEPRKGTGRWLPPSERRQKRGRARRARYTDGHRIADFARSGAPRGRRSRPRAQSRPSRARSGRPRTAVPSSPSREPAARLGGTTHHRFADARGIVVRAEPRLDRSSQSMTVDAPNAMQAYPRTVTERSSSNRRRPNLHVRVVAIIAFAAVVACGVWLGCEAVATAASWAGMPIYRAWAAGWHDLRASAERLAQALKLRPRWALAETGRPDRDDGVASGRAAIQRPRDRAIDDEGDLGCRRDPRSQYHRRLAPRTQLANRRAGQTAPTAEAGPGDGDE